ncbi:hypothetical protein X949_5656 [Burkholderia pseudomallei MSHR5609]|nr:hypothetical protein X949_5656 [Burkholderia pseudomallei MSHR5609]
MCAEHRRCGEQVDRAHWRFTWLRCRGGTRSAISGLMDCNEISHNYLICKVCVRHQSPSFRHGGTEKLVA